jgi:hypothetical protein
MREHNNAEVRQSEQEQVTGRPVERLPVADMHATLAGQPTTEGLLGLQRAAGNQAVAGMMDNGLSSVHNVVGSSGQPLAPEIRTDMESRLGQDFSDVRVHTDSAAHQSAEAVSAHAYTVGSHVVFQRDAFDTSSQQGRTTLAHELTHVVQQRSGPVSGTDVGAGVQVSDPGDRFEREAAATAAQVMSHSPGDGHDHGAS